MYTTAFILSLLSIPVVSAGQHTGHQFRGSRRHHARMIQPVTRQAGCEEASWQCSGSELQRCIGNQWQSIQNCTGQDIICSADLETTGCVWTWSVEQASTDNSTAPSPSPSSAVSLTPSSTPATPPSFAAASPSATLPECEDEYEEYEEQEGDEPSSTSATGSASDPAAPSIIGGNLAAGGGGGHSWYTRSRDSWEGGSSGGWSASSSTDAWAPSSTDQWASATSTDQWTSASSTGWSEGSWSDSSASTDQWAQPSWSSASATATEDWQQSGAPTSTPTGTPGGHGGNHPSPSVSVSASASANSTGSGSGSGFHGGNGGGSQGNWKAPHYVVYSDYWLHNMPDVSSLAQFNRFILAFWMSDRGAVDNAQMWEWMDAGDRQQVLDSYHSAGIALMVSAFGSTDAPVTNGVDAADCARRLAAWVKQYNLDGVDIDWEDMEAMNTNRGEAWLITFQAELRRQLPAGQYLISHAPVAPWFTSGPDYASGAYVKVHQEVGSGIDFYNIQFYNQGAGVYEDCQSLVVDSSASSWPDTSVLEINSYAGVPFDKIVIGKPINAGAAANGYTDPDTLSQCVEQAESRGWNGGIMYWEWNSDAPHIMAVSRGQ